MSDLPRTTKSGRILLRRFTADPVHVYLGPTKPGNGVSRVHLDRLLDDQLVTLGEHEHGLGRRLHVTERGRAVLAAHPEGADLA
ncbi:Uncharacterised protein [Nocardia otitidiscaviarum]|uniref:ArsR family transcriptional regulator n=1 Tax=Nocardia otitidiscaviarum TaxID=1823 RepID=A0A378Y746_9NOCA|nr:hypothetical protein [Nocardia otitidiscaviarum]SUA72618.1 Uncharacterised protein [Nocardia otitidiscaviarum]SUA72678.1 Uncharacterised protein [Nocardia otitidiscaviarum]